MTIDAAITEAVAKAVAPLEREIREMRAMIDPPKVWGTVAEAADHYGRSKSTIRRRIADGRLESKGSGALRRVRLDR